MRKIILVGSVLFMVSCGSSIDETKLQDYVSDVCSCASKATSQEEWNDCNTKRKAFFSKFGIDPDDATGNKLNDQMYNCLSEYDKF